MQRDAKTENKDPERSKRRRLPPKSTNVRTNAFETKATESNCKKKKVQREQNRERKLGSLYCWHITAKSAEEAKKKKSKHCRGI